MQHKFQFFSTLAIFLLLLNSLACKNPTQTRRYPVDVTTAATPNGKKLNPAEQGPVRSVLGEPKIDLATFRLTISGLVDSSFALSWQEIQQHPAVFSDTILMYCVEGWEVWGNWQGILIPDLLRQTKLKPDASHVLFHCVEGYTTTLPLAYLEKYQCLLAYAVNGKFLAPQDGFPLRLVAFGKYGYKWAKWVTALEVIAEPVAGYWEARGYPDRADVPLSRREFYEGPTVTPLIY